MVPRPRWLLLWAVVWTVAYGWTYVVTARGLGGQPASWYLALLVVAVLAVVVAMIGWSWRPALIAGAVLLALAMIIAIATLGFFLLPAVVFAAFPIGMQRPRPAFSDPVDEEPATER
jgi:hypothetical protein